MARHPTSSCGRTGAASHNQSANDNDNENEDDEDDMDEEDEDRIGGNEIEEELDDRRDEREDGHDRKVPLDIFQSIVTNVQKIESKDNPEEHANQKMKMTPEESEPAKEPSTTAPLIENIETQPSALDSNTLNPNLTISEIKNHQSTLNGNNDSNSTNSSSSSFGNLNFNNFNNNGGGFPVVVMIPQTDSDKGAS